ncbi:MAG TPA: DUF3140 domain-containing protein [Allosphingosinicella sp.]|nr:DUF3140 domain-containing protein [Allosphingosinicella sp.]
MTGIDRDQIRRDFGAAVNMAPAELEQWLETEESRKVGWKADRRSESIGHASGRRIVGLLRKRKAALSDDDYAHMRKVAGYVARHRAQRPENVVTSRWRYSLMNWGHDPLKDEPL